jgi:uncharacterized low-complexity protein
MNSTKSRKSIAIAVGTALAGGLSLTGSAFAMQPLSQGYLLGSSTVAVSKSIADANCGASKKAESNCGASKKAESNCGANKKAEGKCGEGKCGVAMMDTNKDGVVERSEFLAMHEGKADMFDKMDTDHDGKLTTAEHDAFMKSMSGEGKCGEGKCGGTI